MSEIKPLFVRNLISKNPRLLKWIERNSQYREDAGPYRILEKYLLRLIYLIAIKEDSNSVDSIRDDTLSIEDSNVQKSETDISGSGSGSNTATAVSPHIVKVQSLLDEAQKLKKTDINVLKTQRGAQTRRQKLWNQIKGKNKTTTTRDNTDSNIVGQKGGKSGTVHNNNTLNNPQQKQNAYDKNVDESGIELYDCICCANSNTARYMRFDTFNRLKYGVYYCDYCSVCIRVDNDPKNVTPVYYCKHKAYHPNGIFIVCNHCAHVANLLMQSQNDETD